MDKIKEAYENLLKVLEDNNNHHELDDKISDLKSWYDGLKLEIEAQFWWDVWDNK